MKKIMKGKTFAVLFFAVLFFSSITIWYPSFSAAQPTVLSLPPDPKPVPESLGIGTYISGGRNVEAYKYITSPGYPPFPDKAKFIGMLTGNWYQMGVKFAERSGDATRWVSDIWWKECCDKFGKTETLKAMELYEDQIAALDPNLITFMQVIANGAAPWLNQSVYADKNHPLYATNYERVLLTNVYDEWAMMHPRMFPDGTSTYGGSVPPSLPAGIAMCSGFAARGSATANGELIVTHNRQAGLNPRAYEQVYIIKPLKGNATWVLTNSPQVSGNMIVNEKGLSVVLFAGGYTNNRSLNYNGVDYFAEGFGVSWFPLLVYIGTHANTAEEAIEMLTVGTQAYRTRTGRNSLLRGGGWLFLVADSKSNAMAIVETTADRYAVRYPGEYSGPNFTNPDYIVCTNNNLAPFSYDRNNQLTDVPMTIFSDQYTYDAGGNVTGLSTRGVRFWTMMWDMEHNKGKIDNYLAQYIMRSLFANDKDTGEAMECAEDNGVWRLWGHVKPTNVGSSRMTMSAGSNDGKVAILDDKKSIVQWTMGNPPHWQGAWDEYRFGD
ncbi:MAG: hypothetical protein AB7Y74_00755 [Syntrophorhabdus sp.]